MAEEFAERKDYKKSLEYYKLYEALSAKYISDSMQSSIEQHNRQNEITRLKQQKLIADKDVLAAELDKERHRRHRNLILLASLLLLGLALITFYHYTSKRRQHRELSVAYKDLDLTKQDLQQAEQRIRTLLNQQVSGDIAQELIKNDAQDIGSRHFVCIMFLDIRDFTPMAEKLSPEDLIAFQNKTFGFMMDIIQARHGNINQLLGDGFMATFGAPVSHGNDCANAFFAAKEILQEVEKRNKSELGQDIKIGIGLHAGHVVTGNVGNAMRKQYSVTGNAVIIASRLEQLNKKYKSSIIISQDVIETLPTDLRSAALTNYTAEKVKGRSESINILIIRSSE